ncbi:helicase [Xylanibacillus composti]|uniref:DNA 3'-5' helicase n=1 Tax=Xylanibacillus composti TaxID=1572762 RepID=A0A8J4H359_9BACL|nr:DNA repair helicase XPB [Xylanibacillus composti]MDT9724152.1 helicase [Xylanibacillus composti]GIQ68701.1 DEAD/DEAH box helicase [Xylanibacillus composti]
MTKPLMIQTGQTLLADARNPAYAAIRDKLAGFAELVKSPDDWHTYRMTAISLWNAAAAGVRPEEVIEVLTGNSRYPVSLQLQRDIYAVMSRYGKVRLVSADDKLLLKAEDQDAWEAIRHARDVRDNWLEADDNRMQAYLLPAYRGMIKNACMQAGYPVVDQAGYRDGEHLNVQFRERTAKGSEFQLRDYQRHAVDRFYQEGTVHGGSGIVVLPCGAGKTIVGLGAMVTCKCATLILTTNTTSVKQWKREILDKTALAPDMIGEYAGKQKQVRPVTIATYHMLTYRSRDQNAFVHMKLFQQRKWGLIIYDEVHLLPAPVFRATAELQAARRLGLTATLVREDGREGDAFSLVGPKTFDLPWRSLEVRGFLAEVRCAEVRVKLSERDQLRYLEASPRAKPRIAGDNTSKDEVAAALIHCHHDKPVLVIGQYLQQLRRLSGKLQAPLITGQTSQEERERLFDRFRKGHIPVLIVSKVANFAVDLPDAAVAIQVSGSYGSRQEEAQRLGRVLRPKQNGGEAYFYSLVSADTREEQDADRRRLFLLEQGYCYERLQESDVWKRKEAASG